MKKMTCMLMLASLVACGGSAGPPGPSGPSGSVGNQGPQGSQGVQGAQGVQGSQGEMGTQGSKGAQGEMGVPGEAGAPGAQGAMGEAGSAGPTDDIMGSIGCVGTISGGPLTGTYSIGYTADQFSDGAIFANAYVGDTSFSTSGSAFFAPQQTGWNTAPVTFVYDVYGTADGGWWLISLDRSTLVVSITYNDTDLGGTGTSTWDWHPSQCTVNTY
jgi:hypothetical protein